MCGSVMKTQPSYTFTETTGRPEFSLLVRDEPEAGRGTIGASKSFRQAEGAGVHAARVQRCWPTTRRSVCPTTARSRSLPGAST